MINIGLTGGIATGKTTVSNYMKDLGCIIIDTDLITHSLYNYPSKACEMIIEEFGEDCLENNQINRKILSSKVFSNPGKLKKLNSIIHPLVRKEVKREVEKYQKLQKQNENFIIVQVIPLLFEASLENTVDSIVVVACSETNQLERLIKRDNFTKEMAKKRINSQLPIMEKIILADYIIDTNVTMKEIKDQVINLLDYWDWDPFKEDLLLKN